MKSTSILFAAVATVMTLAGIRSARAQADIPADYLSIIGNTAGTVSDGYGSPGSIPVHGKASFPILIDANNVPALAAGRYGNGVSATAARAVAAAHTGFFNTSGTNTTSQLFLNSVLWASRKATPATITVGSNNSTIRSFFTARGYLTKSISTSMSTAATDLSGCDVFVGNFHDGFTAAAITKINTHAANGGGVVVCSTPWALNAQPYADAQTVLEPFGLSVSGSGTAVGTFTVAAASYPSYHSALNGLDALIADVTSGPTMTLAQKQVAAGAVDRVLAVRPTQPEILAGLQILENSGYGIVQVTAAVPLVKANKPVEAMLARFQSGKFDAMTAAQLIAHPSASDWPGSPAAGSTVSKNFAVNGTVPADVYMNQGSRGRRIETRLYAAPGATLTVTIPADKVAAGIALDIGCHIDENFHLAQWNRFPKVTRRVPLTQMVTQTGNVFGGLVWIVIPAGSNLGNFDITIAGALEAPCFQLGVDTDATWNATLKNLPGAWGCIMTDNVPGFGNTPGFTVYVSRAKLQAVASAEAVARHWKNVLATADDRMGYTAFRKRGESALSDRDILAGGGHAGYPVMMAYGDSDVLVNGALKSGDWGFYHELGHTFQDSFDGSYGIATHGEVDVNLPPALLNNLVHDKTCWDGDIHGTFNGGNRLTKRTAFLAQAPASQTWSSACGDGATGYDFYFNLAEAFGWDKYRIALSRLMAWNQGGTDAALTSFAGTSDLAKRNRFYVIFCDATGRNLDTYFQRYGIGVTGLGYEISATAKSHISAKGYPVWTDNSPVDSISDPGTLAAAENLAPGTVIADLTALDPEEPGTMWTWTITSGNPEGRLVIDKRTGELKVANNGLDREKTASYTLGIQAEDGGVPRYSASRTITLNISNVVEPPMPGTNAVLNATSAMSSGTVLGQGILADVSRTLSATSIVSGNGSGAFSINASGQIVLQTPASLPSASLLTLVISGTDNSGATGFATIRVLANATPGVRELRWSGQTNFNNNTWTGSTNYTGNLTSSTSGQNATDNYSRRLLGWVIPPVTGEYTFWISSDDGSRFYLGTSTTEASKSLLCSVAGYTNFQNFDASGSQVSSPVTLEAGKLYWFEAQQTDGGGGDHVSVAWQGAGIATRSIVAGTYLVPNQAGITASNDLPDPPVFTTDPIVKAGGTQGSSYSGSLSSDATDPDASDTRTYSKISGPTWLTVASNGTLSGTPANANVGPNDFVVRVTDSTGQWDQAAMSIAVANVNDAPTFTTNPITGAGATQDTAYSGTLAGSATDVDAGDSLTYSKVSGPDWLNIATNGPLSGTPGAGNVGTNNWTVQVSDGLGGTTTATLVITVAPATYSLTYNAGTHGALTGTTPQTVNHGASGTAVTAVPDSGYAFSTWSDGSTANPRIDTNVTANLTVTANFTGPGPLPAPWTAGTIGTVTAAVDATHLNGSYHVTGGGANISGKNDNFYFVSQPWSGNCTITARLVSLQNTGSAAKAGVMIRESTATGSRSVFVGLTPSNGAQWVRRSSTGGNSSTTTSAGKAAPYWVRLTRNGNTITSYISPNGITWTQLASAGISLANNFSLGLATCSGASGTPNASVFDSVSVTNTATAPAASIAPTSSPTLGQLTLEEDSVSFNITGEADGTWVLEETTDFVTWTPLQTITLPGGPLQHSEADDRGAKRFFRLQSNP